MPRSNKPARRSRINRSELPARKQFPVRFLAGAALIVGFVFWIYWPALHGGILWDDEAHLTKPELYSLGGLARIWLDVGTTQQYYPLLHTAFWVEHQLWGDALLGYHLINLTEHLTAVWLVYLILKRLNIPGAFLVASIFAVHPVTVESVAWMTEQKNTLSAVFYLGAMLFYLQFVEQRRSLNYVLASLLFVLGLLTKTVTATLPAALLLIMWWQRGKLSWQRDVRPLLLWFIFGATAGLFTAWVERTLIGAEGAAFQLSLVQRVLLAGRAPWFYLSKLIWPNDLIFIYPRWEVDPALAWQWLFPIATLVVLVVLVLVSKKWRGPLAGWLFFIGTLFPVLGFFNVYPFIFSFVADHFQYLASLGIITLVAAGFALFLRKQSPALRQSSLVLTLILLGVLSWLSRRQSRAYADAATLYQTTIDKNPTCWMAYSNLGVIQFEAGQIDAAITSQKAALQLHPDYVEAQIGLGADLAKQGNYQAAIDLYHRALTLKPNDAEAHANLGFALADTGSPQEAIEQLQLALETNPNLPQARFKLAYELKKQGRIPEAIKQYQQTVLEQPNNAEVHNNLAVLLAATGQTQPAHEHYEQALRLNPTSAEAHYGLGNLYMQQSQWPQAITALQQAVKLNPDYAEAHANLGAALAQISQIEPAIEQCRQAIKLKPDYVEAQVNLAMALAQLKRRVEAIDVAMAAIALAREQKKATLASQLEHWLTDYRSQLPESPPQPH